jgi:hypothetical protein
MVAFSSADGSPSATTSAPFATTCSWDASEVCLSRPSTAPGARFRSHRPYVPTVNSIEACPSCSCTYAGLGWLIESYDVETRRDKDGNVTKKVKVRLASGHAARELIAKHLQLFATDWPDFPTDRAELVAYVAKQIERVTGRKLERRKAIDVQAVDVPPARKEEPN